MRPDRERRRAARAEDANAYIGIAVVGAFLAASGQGLDALDDRRSYAASHPDKAIVG